LSEGFAPILLPHNVSSLQKLQVPLDGVIVVDPIENDGVLAFFRNKEIGTVTIGYDPKNPHTPWIDDDNEKGIADLLDRTVVPGEKIAAVTLGPRKSFVVDALRGMSAWASKAGSDVQELHCADLHDGNVDKVLRKVRDRQSDVIVAQNDRVAIKLLARLKVSGVRVPEAIRLVSVADAPELQNTTPSITALRQHPGALGQLAVKVLFDLIRGAETRDCQFLPLEVVLRGSAPSIKHRRSRRTARLKREVSTASR
jgi:DNA-binding LacI/PurR family transcriptional regulator